MWSALLRRLTTSPARLIALAAACLAIMLYTSALGALFVMQRTMLYPGSRPGAPADEAAIPGSARVVISTPDGERLSAWHVPPETRRPVFLFLHGNGGNLPAQTARWQRLRDAGAGVLAVSYRGYDGSTGTPTETGLHTDARAAYDWLRQRYPAGRIIIHGHSLGSAVATRLASEVESAALVLESPFTAAVDVAAERYVWFPVRALMLDQFRSRDWIGRVKVPIVIAHGVRDATIPFAHGERLYALAPEPKLMVPIAGGGHNSLVRDGLYGHLWPYLAQHARSAWAR